MSVVSDIVDRLLDSFRPSTLVLREEAAVEIDRLRASRAELLAALEWIAEDGGVCARAAECARAAIEKDASS